MDYEKIHRAIAILYEGEPNADFIPTGLFMLGHSRRDGETLEQVADRIIDGAALNKVGNPNHDKLGRFSTGTGSSSKTVSTDSLSEGGYHGLFPKNGGKEFNSESQIGEYVNTYSKGMPPKNQYEALNTWVGAGGCLDMQDSARGIDKGDYIAQMVTGLDEATHSSSLKDSVNLYRGMSITKNQLDTMVSKGTFKSKTFFATALNHDRVEKFFVGHSAGYDSELKDFRQPTMFRIHAKKGTKGYFADSRYPSAEFHNGLGEFIPSRSNTYSIKNVTYINDGDVYRGAVVDLETQ